MPSLRLLIVLSIVVRHGAQPPHPKYCVAGNTIYKSNNEVDRIEDHNHEYCSTGWCALSVTRNEQYHLFKVEQACGKSRSSSVSYECLPEVSIGVNSNLICYCNASSLCNTPELMFDSKGDDGQKARADSLAKIGIKPVTSVKAGEKTTKFVWDANFGKKCMNWSVIVPSNGNPDTASITQESCSSDFCFMKIKRNEVDKTFELDAACASSAEKDANQIASGKMYKCTTNSDELTLNCYCTITNIWPYCNSPLSLFHDEETDEQRERIDQLSSIGIIAENLNRINRRETNLRWDDYFGEKCMEWNTISTSDSVEETAPKRPRPCSTGLCYMKLKRNEVDKTVELEARCATDSEKEANTIPPGKNTTCRTIPEDLTSTCFCKISTIVCNTVVNLFNHHDGGDKLTRYQRLRVIGIDTNLEKKESRQTLEGDIKFDIEFGKTTTTEATTTTLYTGPYEPPFADDPHYDELEDAATGVSLTFVVLIAILRLI